jgi:hypothetical protein
MYVNYPKTCVTQTLWSSLMPTRAVAERCRRIWGLFWVWLVIYSCLHYAVVNKLLRCACLSWKARFLKQLCLSDQKSQQHLGSIARAVSLWRWIQGVFLWFELIWVSLSCYSSLTAPLFLHYTLLVCKSLCMTWRCVKNLRYSSTHSCGYAVAQLAEAMRYKPEGPRNFSLA